MKRDVRNLDPVQQCAQETINKLDRFFVTGQTDTAEDEAFADVERRQKEATPDRDEPLTKLAIEMARWPGELGQDQFNLRMKQFQEQFREDDWRLTLECLCERADTAEDEAFAEIERKPDEGQKFDTDKPLMSLLPPNTQLAVARVLTFGARKYAPDNWRQVPDLQRRYLDAALRHINAVQCGETDDVESGEHHYAHAICCLMFMLEDTLLKEARHAK